MSYMIAALIKTFKVFGNTLKKIFQNHLLVVLVFLGSFFIFLGHVFSTKSIYGSVFVSIGTTILCGGVFTGTLRFFQHIGAIKEEINGILDEREPKVLELLRNELSKVIFSPNFLEINKNINSIWDKVTSVLYKDRFPNLRGIETTLRKVYLPDSNTAYYYKEFSRIITVDWFDKSDKMIEVNEDWIMELIPAVDHENISIKYNYKSAPEAPNTEHQLKKFSIDNVNLTKEFQKHKPDSLSTVYSYNTHLPWKKNHVINRTMQYCFSLIEDPIWTFSTKRFIENTEIKIILNSPDINVSFHSMGMPNEFEDLSLDAIHKLIHRKYNGLIFPKCGFILNFTEKMVKKIASRTII